jgi:molybdopterin synthase sulfur carrier subunit
MQVKLYASLRQKVGLKQVEVEVPPEPTIKDVLQDLAVRYPVLKEHIFSDDGSLVHHIQVIINGHSIRTLQGLDTPVKPEDKVDIFPPLVGG